MFTLTVSILTILGIFMLGAAGAIWSGFVLNILWGWFMVPTFGLAPLSLPAAIGISLVIGYLTHQYQKKNSGDVDGWAATVDAVFNMVARPALALLAGWIVKQWL